MVLILQVLIEMDRKDEECGRMEEMYQQLRTAYCQFTLLAKRNTSTSGCSSGHDSESNVTELESARPGYSLTTSGCHSLLKKPC